jgi:hypothetical protein
MKKEDEKKHGAEPQANSFVITPEEALSDIRKEMQQNETVGEGSKEDRAADSILQVLRVASRHANTAELLGAIYLENPIVSELLPGTLRSKIVNKVVSGEITIAKAKEAFDQAIPQYLKAFETLGVKPHFSSMVFAKPPKFGSNG